MLSFIDGGRPIAVVKGGEYDNKIVFYHDKYDPKLNKSKQINLKKILKTLEEDKIDYSDMQMSNIRNSIYNKKIPIQNLKLYNKLKEIDDKNDEIEIHDEGEMIPMPSENERDIIYVAGPSGCGKSTFSNMYGRMFMNRWPKHKVRLFSKLTRDPSIDKLDPIRFEIGQNLIENPVQISDIDGTNFINEDGEVEKMDVKNEKKIPKTLVIFDDIDTTRDRKVKEQLKSLEKDLLETGRHNNVYMIITSHMISNYAETRSILNECSEIVIFPNTNNKQISYALMTYCGMDKVEVRRLLNLPSKWVLVRKNMPRLVLYSKGAYLLN